MTTIIETEDFILNNSDFKQTAEKYKSEMMRLYNASPMPKSDIIPVESTSMSGQEADTEQETSDLTDDVLSEENTPEEQTIENANADMPVEERFPSPVLPEFIRELPKPVENNSFGFLKVNVRTGNGGLPVKDSIVTISEIKNGEENVLHLLSTDESGATEAIELPAPTNSKGSSPQDYESFAKYNISVYSKGFFRETSVDAPIFAGITSVQTFYLIPEPFDYNSGEQTIVDRNPEPLI